MLRRRGPQCAAHPGQECGPCVLCVSPSPDYSLGLDKISFFFFLFFFSFMLDKSTYFAFPIPILLSFSPILLSKNPFLHTVIKVQAKIRESNEQGCIAT